ncbi:restriction endonuclease [Streptococcus intermedius]|uniref:restriction endonuclease n=1 Tax=Streptococcus intermedius TaxID=1338 RepID=UPI000C856042|nr:restriction endonuclease [Streptococcus intermedius]PMR92601.1 restriction endonuclease [Streptococcus intermedius]
MNFTDLSNKEQEKIMISKIIRNLKKLGGYATKRELLDAIKKGENTIDENFFEEEKVSQKSGKFINLVITLLIFLSKVCLPRVIFLNQSNRFLN